MPSGEASDSRSTAQGRSRRPISGPRTWRRRRTTSSWSHGRRRSSISMRPTAGSEPRAAARTRCPSTSSAPDVSVDLDHRGIEERLSMAIDWDPSDRQFHLRNGQISLVLRVFEDGTLGQLHLGAALPGGRSYRHLGPDPFPGFSNRVGSPVPLAYPTSGTGDFRVPALVAASADGATSLALHYQRHRIRRRQAGARRPPLDLRRRRRRGRDARDHPGRRAGRPRGRPALHDLCRPAVDRPERHDPQRRVRAG